MRAIIRPGTARGTVAAPPSKSMAHRLLICAGLADGESLVEGVDPSEDILATIDCLEALGASIRREGSAVPESGSCCPSLPRIRQHPAFYDPPVSPLRSADAPGRQPYPAEPSALRV